MSAELHPFVVWVVAAVAVPFLGRRAKRALLLAVPVLSLAIVVALPAGEHGQLQVLDYTVTLLRVDRLSLVFAWVFHIAALLGVIFALHVDDDLQHCAALVYAGSAIGALLSGDMLSLFVYWELTAMSSVFLIWASRSERAYRAGLRYLVVQVGSGVLLFAGVLVIARESGSIEFTHMPLDGPGPWLVFLAFGIKCAFPLLHNWLQDAYPESTPTGTVVLSVFSTKLAVYALARGFAGTEILVPIGALMAAFPIFYAVIENDLRRVLSYSLNNMLGFMVVGVGVGTELALNGTAAHAFASILYQALLFMSMGAVLHRVGTVKGSELGGLYRSMPWTTAFCVVGAASISAFPLFSGFVTKSLTMTATAEAGYAVAWFVLLAGSAGVLLHSGIKIPYYTFFGHDSGLRCEEAPRNMLVAMGATAALCVLIGVFPQPLYALLPYPIPENYHNYTADHVVTTLQLLLFAVLGFALLVRYGLYPPELRSTNLDSDWIYRRALPAAARGVLAMLEIASAAFGLAATIAGAVLTGRLARDFGDRGVLARAWPSAAGVVVVVATLAALLLS